MQLGYLTSRSLRNAVRRGEPGGDGDSAPDQRRGDAPGDLSAQPPVGPDLYNPAPPAPRVLAARSALARLKPQTRSAPDPRAILDSIGQTVYDWDLHTDRIQWGPNAGAVIGVKVIEFDPDRPRLCRLPLARQRKLAFRGDHALGGDR